MVGILSKYRSQKTVVDGHVFPSKLEARRYSMLRLMEQQGEIYDLVLQPKFLLQEGFRDRNGEWHRPIHYIADFRYAENNRVIVEEVKGQETAVYRIKKKLFMYKYPDIDYRVLRRGDF